MLCAVKRKSVALFVTFAAFQLGGLSLVAAMDDGDASACQFGLVNPLSALSDPSPPPLVLRSESEVLHITARPYSRKKIKQVNIQIYAIARAAKSSETLGLVARVNFRWGNQMPPELRSYFTSAARIPTPEAFESEQAYREFKALAMRVNTELGGFFLLDPDFDFQYLFYVRPGDSDFVPTRLPISTGYRNGFVSHIEFLVEHFSGALLAELLRSIDLPEGISVQMIQEDPDMASRF